MRLCTTAPALVLLALSAGCGAGQFGFSQTYVTLSEEDDFADGAQEAVYEDVKRDPVGYRSQNIGWFGIVTSVEAGPNGSSLVHMTHRVHQERHLCADETDASCRVTVADRTSGPWTAVLTMRPEDREGQDRLTTGSLLKVYGAPNGDFDAEGGPVLAARYYRHWPRGAYVTTGDRNRMRR
jgi:hypothetical protein